VQRLTARIVASIAGVLALGLALPAVASADPLWPGGPDVPWYHAPQAPAPQKPKPQPQQSPAGPPVPTSTGWEAVADDTTHQMTVWHNNEVVKTIPISMGSNAHPTPNGVYHTMTKEQMVVMDSSTYGVPVDSPEGYKTDVYWAQRMTWDGIYLHAAPWSVKQQGNSDVSHGCINVSNENAKWAFDNFPVGTPIVVKNTVGGQLKPGQ